MIFAGPSRTPEQWYQAADLLLFPSRYEAFSRVTLEAAGCGLPIVAHAINGTEDLITHGENGFLSAMGVDALRAHVLQLRDDTALRTRMRAAIAATSARYAAAAFVEGAPSIPNDSMTCRRSPRARSLSAPSRAAAIIFLGVRCE